MSPSLSRAQSRRLASFVAPEYVRVATTGVMPRSIATAQGVSGGGHVDEMRGRKSPIPQGVFPDVPQAPELLFHVISVFLYVLSIPPSARLEWGQRLGMSASDKMFSYEARRFQLRFLAFPPGMDGEVT